jgi:hypothetical protein
MRVELSSFIESDLDTIADYIAQDNPTRAVSFIQEIRAKSMQLERILCYIGYGPTSARARGWRSRGDT